MQRISVEMEVIGERGGPGSARLAKGPLGRSPPPPPHFCRSVSAAQLSSSCQVTLVVIEPGPGPRHRTEEVAMKAMPYLLPATTDFPVR